MGEFLMLPALSSISTAGEFGALVGALGGALGGGARCRVVDWPGFGARSREGRLSARGMQGFLDGIVAGVAPGTVGIGAGHAATYLVAAAGRWPGRLAGLVLVAPTWRGPLPTMFSGGRRPGLAAGVCRAVRTALEAPVVGAGLYRLNMSQFVVGRMMRAHVYADAGFVTPELMAAKRAVTRRAAGRFGTAAFVTGGLDPVGSRAAFLALFEAAGLPPVLLVRPEGAPVRSGAEMDALAATGRVRVVRVPGRWRRMRRARGRWRRRSGRSWRGWAERRVGGRVAAARWIVR